MRSKLGSDWAMLLASMSVATWATTAMGETPAGGGEPAPAGPSLTLLEEAAVWRAMAEPWANQRTPLFGLPQVMGRTTSGCLVGAIALPPTGHGFRIVRPRGNGRFGHPDTIDYVRRLGERVAGAGLGALLVGELSQPRGGPYPRTHLSHQTGLDVDIAYLTTGVVEELAVRTSTFLSDPQSALRFNRRHLLRLLRLAADDERVDRIYVHPSIKRLLCNRFPDEQALLSKLKAWWGHQEHLHVRLRCPADSPRCTSNEAVPTPDGCGPALDWWFTVEAQKAWRHFQQRRRTHFALDMPGACAAVPDRSVPPRPAVVRFPRRPARVLVAKPGPSAR